MLPKMPRDIPPKILHPNTGNTDRVITYFLWVQSCIFRLSPVKVYGFLFINRVPLVVHMSIGTIIALIVPIVNIYYV